MIVEAATVLISLVNKLIDLFPDYEQKKKEEFYYLKKRYEEAKSQSFPLRDDNQVEIYRNDLIRFIETFNTYLDVKKNEKK